MKIVFIVDYYPELRSKAEFSGAEVSISLLAEALVEKGLEVALVGPIERSSDQKFQSAWKVGNPVWYFFSTVRIWKKLRAEKADVIHIHGKNVLVGGFLASLLLHKPLVVTVRDYRLLCDLGMCLLDGDKICNAWQYLTRDIPKFVKEYKDGSLVSWLRAYMVGVYQLFQRPLYLSLLRLADKVVCISHAQEKIYRRRGVKNTLVIYNIGYTNVVKRETRDQIFFGGKYSLGKGARILARVIPRFLQKHPRWRAIFVGRGRPSINDSRCVVTGPVSYTRYEKILSRSALAVVPSVWPEPFGRAALDALIVGTPVVVSNRGGLPEIVERGVTGEVAELNPDDFLQKIELVANNNKKYQANIIQGETSLRRKFFSHPIKQHIALYKSLL